MSRLQAQITRQPLSSWVDQDLSRGRFRVSRRAFIEPAVLALERKAIFSRCWLYLGHESELPNPNDFLTRSVGGRELIFNRDRKGVFRAFFNTCPHRGATVVREPRGNALGFKCFYHGWAFNNNGAFSTRFQPETYPGDFNADGCANLVAVPRLAAYRGFYFLNYDPDAVPLEAYLARATEILDLVADHAPGGMEIIGGTQDYSIEANWKLLAENSFDGYHAMETHSTYFEYLLKSLGVNSFGAAPLQASGGGSRCHDLGNGHAVIEGPAPWGRPIAKWIAPWGEAAKPEFAAMRDELASRVGPQRAERIATRNRNLVIFPNLVINDIMAITVRTFYPEGPDHMTVNSWALGPKGEPRDARKRRLDNFLEFLGPGGFATPDDVEALQSCQRGYRNAAAAGWNDISRGMLREIPANDDEEQMRCFWREWGRRMAAAEAGALS
jgi:p-cumate 2,3-dioxygenase alpha subunit